MGITDDGARSMTQTLQTSSHPTSNDHNPPIEILDFDMYFDIEESVAYLLTHAYTRVALQFPDALLVHAPTVQAHLVSALALATFSSSSSSSHSVFFFILGDTSYGSCCVDETAATHLNAACVIHYGPACISTTSCLPVHYVFGSEAATASPLNLGAVSKALQTVVTDASCVETTLVLLYDVTLLYAMDQVTLQLEGFCHERNAADPTRPPMRVIVGQVPSPCPPHTRSSDLSSDLSSDTYFDASLPLALKLGGLVCPGLECLDTSVLLVYLPRASTDPQASKQCTSISLSVNNSRLLIYNRDRFTMERATLRGNKQLMRRYYLVQKAIETEIIGILVGTLAVTHYNAMITALRRLIADSGRKSYLFVVGKINVAKLANYADIDLFVLVACPENSLLDCKEFYKPIVTPFELNLALNPAMTWTGEYELDFARLLPTLAYQGEKDKEASDQNGEDDDAPTFSLVSGTYHHTTRRPSRPRSPPTSPSSDSATPDTACLDSKDHTTTTTRHTPQHLSLAYESPAAERLKAKSYQGLEMRRGMDAPQAAIEGAFGIARGYTMT